MAIYHLSAKIIGRTAGQSSVASAAYRAGEELHDDRTGQTFRFARAERVMHAEIVAPANAPAWAYDRSTLWNAVEAGERRKDAQLARDFELALPVELDLAQQQQLVRDWIAAEFTPAGAVADFAIHHDRDERNPHCHVMTTMRALGPDGWSKQKLRQWEDRSALARWRSSWADHVNAALERAGRAERVDHRSYAEQDADKPAELRREPTRKVGPWAVGGDRGRENHAIKVRNQERLRHLATFAKRVATRAIGSLSGMVSVGQLAGIKLADLTRSGRAEPEPTTTPIAEPESSRTSQHAEYQPTAAEYDELERQLKRQEDWENSIEWSFRADPIVTARVGVTRKPGLSNTAQKPQPQAQATPLPSAAPKAASRDPETREQREQRELDDLRRLIELQQGRGR